MVIFRSTQVSDLDYVLAAEQNQENNLYVTSWSREQHVETLTNPNFAHLIVEIEPIEKTNQLDTLDVRVGYIILQGLENPHQNIELVRLVITKKGQGYGRGTIELIKEIAFNKYQAHRLWLDVKEFNYRAQSLYKSAGFVLEGTLRECLKTQDGYESLQIMSILRQEYRQM
jgi:diamine N-acetyltransferase